ncbi:MAG: hypothetical protein IPL59_08465 [Candidatus Competibacteraceae bacterium]|nr:hypothetical protein [Candidatus Competibacteraceae bacterium]
MKNFKLARRTRIQTRCFLQPASAHLRWETGADFHRFPSANQLAWVSSPSSRTKTPINAVTPNFSGNRQLSLLLLAIRRLKAAVRNAADGFTHTVHNVVLHPMIFLANLRTCFFANSLSCDGVTADSSLRTEHGAWNRSQQQQTAVESSMATKVGTRVRFVFRCFFSAWDSVGTAAIFREVPAPRRAEMISYCSSEYS